MTRRVVAVLVLAGLIAASAASAKEFDPGDLRLCNGHECKVLVDRELLRGLGSFIYGQRTPVRAATPRHGAPVLRLTFRNGYVAGDVGGVRLDRFRSHGVICGRFQQGVWYRLPPRIAHGLGRAAGQLEPLRFTGSIPRSC
jgi:hypothetical protein